MYVYDEHDKQIAAERVAQFRDQTERALAGELSEEEFLPLRLQNGLYVQRHAPMLRICVPYGMLRSEQLRRLARITRDYDRGYAHVTTRTNIQLNWPNLEDVPDILAELAEVKCMPTRPAATASVTPPQTSSPVCRQMKLPTRAPTAKSSASGRPSIRSSRFCPASSRLQ